MDVEFCESTNPLVDTEARRINIIERILSKQECAIGRVLLTSIKETRGIDYGMGIRVGIRFSGFDIDPYSVVCANVITGKSGIPLSKPMPVLVGFRKTEIVIVTNAILATVLMKVPYSRSCINTEPKV